MNYILLQLTVCADPFAAVSGIGNRNFRYRVAPLDGPCFAVSGVEDQGLVLCRQGIAGGDDDELRKAKSGWCRLFLGALQPVDRESCHGASLATTHYFIL